MSSLETARVDQVNPVGAVLANKMAGALGGWVQHVANTTSSASCAAAALAADAAWLLLGCV